MLEGVVIRNNICVSVKQEVLYIPIERTFVGFWYGLASLISTVSIFGFCLLTGTEQIFSCKILLCKAENFKDNGRLTHIEIF